LSTGIYGFVCDFNGFVSEFETILFPSLETFKLQVLRFGKKSLDFTLANQQQVLKDL
jgi:hypothetical protein